MWLACITAVLIHRLDTRQNLPTEHHVIKEEYVPVAGMLPTTVCALYEQLQYTVNEETKKLPFWNATLVSIVLAWSTSELAVDFFGTRRRS